MCMCLRAMCYVFPNESKLLVDTSLEAWTCPFTIKAVVLKCMLFVFMHVLPDPLMEYWNCWDGTCPPPCCVALYASGFKIYFFAVVKFATLPKSWTVISLQKMYKLAIFLLKRNLYLPVLNCFTGPEMLIQYCPPGLAATLKNVEVWFTNKIGTCYFTCVMGLYSLFIHKLTSFS